MSDDEKCTLWIGAFRYYCGRTTYAVQDFTDILIRQWFSLPKRCREIIQRDLSREFQLDDEARQTIGSHKPLGWQCDRDAWERVRINCFSKQVSGEK